MGASYECPNSRECEHSGGFALCRECMNEASAAMVGNKEDSEEDTNKSRRTRTNALSPGSRNKRRSRMHERNAILKSGAEALKSNKKKCCDAHNDIKNLREQTDGGFYKKDYMNKWTDNYPPRQCYCCKSEFCY